MSIEDKFLRYVGYDTQSNPESPTAPSTEKQLLLADQLKKELEELGMHNVIRNEYGIVYAELPANAETDMPSIGLIAHMDTAQELPGKDVKPRIIRHWNGRRIRLNDEFSMDSHEFPELERALGKDIVVTDGTTLLGADDKAGIAIIMQTLEEILENNPRHGKIMVAFTPDEEIGRGTANFDLNHFDVDYAYTLDGGAIDEVAYETFNAAEAIVRIQGKSIHPGSAKNLMINASQVACKYAEMMPMNETPATTEGREGYIHLVNMQGDCDHAIMHYIIRDFDKWQFQRRKELMKDAAKLINTQYGKIVSVDIEDQYENMYEYVKNDMRPVDHAYIALTLNGIDGHSTPVRGGTDGAMLSAKGLPTPNLGTGGGNCHGRYEFAALDDMKTMVKVLRCILEGQDGLQQ